MDSLERSPQKFGHLLLCLAQLRAGIKKIFTVHKMFPNPFFLGLKND
jgi:hypothetical protein